MKKEEWYNNKPKIQQIISRSSAFSPHFPFSRFSTNTLPKVFSTLFTVLH